MEGFPRVPLCTPWFKSFSSPATPAAAHRKSLPRIRSQPKNTAQVSPRAPFFNIREGFNLRWTIDGPDHPTIHAMYFVMYYRTPGAGHAFC
jgi:hypothetical protein